MHYTYIFTCRLECDKEESVIMPEWISMTRDFLNKKEAWYDYIYSAFHDLLDEELNGYEGSPPANPIPIPPIELCNFSISLEDRDGAIFSITLDWDALEVNKSSLDESIEGQMQYIIYDAESKIYELNNNSMDWYISIL